MNNITEKVFTIKSCLYCLEDFIAYRSGKYCNDCKPISKKIQALKDYNILKSKPNYLEISNIKQKKYRETPKSKVKRKEYHDKWKSRNPEYYKLKYRELPKEIRIKKRRKQLLDQYNLTEDQFNKMIISQNNLCAICNNPQTGNRLLAVDHCHKTGKVRGLLCTKCNNGIGNFNDNIEILNKAIHYLIKDGEV